MKHFTNNGKEYLKMKEKQDKSKGLSRQYRSNQGRSPEHMERTYKGCAFFLLAFILIAVFYSIYNLIIS